MRTLALLLLLAGCPSGQAPRPAPTASPSPSALDVAPVTSPKLVVLLVIDQWPQWAFVQKRAALAKGFERLLREGEWHTGRHPSAATLTAPGHALLGTGEPSATSGIIANEFWSRLAGRIVKSIEGDDGVIGPQRLRVPGLGAAVAAANTGAKAFAISLKDRAAILPLGGAGTAIWYDRKAATMTSNGQVPWLAGLPAIMPRAKEPWVPLDAAQLAKLSGTTDDHAGEVGEKGFGPTFPHAATKTKDPREAVFALPLGNEIVFETALAAITNEKLGADANADLLVLSLSAHDYVGHGWGHESWEAWDMMLRLDEQLGRFMTALDARVGDGNWAMVVTSDHGAAPLPERAGGGRIAYEDIADAANRAASIELGTGTWVLDAKYPNIFLAPAVLAHKDRDKAIRKILLAVRSFPGIALAARTVDYAGNCDRRDGDARTICLALDIERSGELFYLMKRNWIGEERDERVATAHGSIQDYDRDVPVILLAPDRKPHAAATAPSGMMIEMTRIAPLVARWLGVTAPSKLPR